MKKIYYTIISLCLISCQEKNNDYSDDYSKCSRWDLPQDFFIKADDNLTFEIWHLSTPNHFKMEVAPGQLNKLVEKINIFKLFTHDSELGRFSHFPDGSPVKSQPRYGYYGHAFILMIYTNGEYTRMTSFPYSFLITKDKYLKSGTGSGFKIDISECFTKSSWEKVDFKNLEPYVYVSGHILPE